MAKVIFKPGEGGSGSGDSDANVGGYVAGLVLVAFWTVPKYGWGEGLLKAALWPFILMYYMFYGWWV